MARTADEQRRVELLERIVDYVMENGLSDLSLRPLADAVGSSARGLLYYFGSKEQLIAEMLTAAGGRQRAAFDRLPRNAASYRETVRAAWRVLSAPENGPIFRLFFEVYGLALQDPSRYPGFLERAVDVWLDYLEPSALRDGYSKADARAIASVILAGYRGFLLDVLTTGDRRRLDRAVDIWIEALDAIPSPKELPRARRR
ncbi:MAG TPA: TetR/AcrR family transcriptional regulator [Candidatus Elarobacter sp.]|jgi:AcrR family transcriptional regulator|nr:TetR/AcrR family transcriptional regulator [Candidatus Elarobacter sp.]